MNGIQKVHDQFKHLDPVFMSVSDDESVFHRTCKDLWVAICEEVKEIENKEREVKP